MSRPAAARIAAIAVPVAALAIAAGVLGSVYRQPLACPERCIVDHVALRGPMLGNLELPDVRLNAWIVAWVQHALTTDPTSLFEANVFHPAPHALTQSEHMLAVALLTLPVRWLGGDAVLVHQVALLASTLLLCLGTGLLVHWLTGHLVAAVAAGLAAGLMPWRLTELSHLQLLNAQWFPLVWLAIGRLVEAPGSRRTALALAVLLALQLLSSFYLAYFLLVSCAALLAGLAHRPGVPARAWRALGAAALLPALGLLALALPYLRWSRAQGFEPVTSSLFDSVSPADALAFLLPPSPLGAETLPVETTYQVPLAVAVLAVVAIGGTLWRPDGPRRRGFVVGLTLACAVAFVLALGRELRIGDLAIPLPARLAASVVPGFEMLRNPLRWTLVIGLATPVLAGIGLARLTSRVRGPLARGGLALALLLAVAASLPRPEIPVRAAWAGPPERREAWRALANLPPGPVIELPWPLQVERDVALASEYMLGSTLHWQPLANGYSGYVPPSYPLVRQIADGLPGEAALERLGALVGVRWIVVHGDDLGRMDARAFARAEREGRLQRVFAAGDTRIYEVVGWTPGVRHREAIRDPAPRPRTLEGLSRAPLAPGDDTGRLSVVVRRPFFFQGGRRVPQVVSLRVTNTGSRPWPGFDVDPEGLVALRYAFLDAEGEVAMRRVVPLAADVPAGETSVLPVPVTPPNRAGRYILRAELVQRVGDVLRPLDVPAYELPVEVRTGRV